MVMLSIILIAESPERSSGPKLPPPTPLFSMQTDSLLLARCDDVLISSIIAVASSVLKGTSIDGPACLSCVVTPQSAGGGPPALEPIPSLLEGHRFQQQTSGELQWDLRMEGTPLEGVQGTKAEPSLVLPAGMVTLSVILTAESPEHSSEPKPPPTSLFSMRTGSLLPAQCDDTLISDIIAVAGSVLMSGETADGPAFLSCAVTSQSTEGGSSDIGPIRRLLKVSGFQQQASGNFQWDLRMGRPPLEEGQGAKAEPSPAFLAGASRVAAGLGPSDGGEAP